MSSLARLPATTTRSVVRVASRALLAARSSSSITSSAATLSTLSLPLSSTSFLPVRLVNMDTKTVHHEPSRLDDANKKSHKIFKDGLSAVKASGLRDGMIIAGGGFALCGVPQSTYAAIRDHGAKNLTIVSNNGGDEGVGLGLLIGNNQVKRVILSYVGDYKELERMFFAGEIELELTPQGTLAEKLRSGGAGIPAFYTRTAYGTVVSDDGFPIKYSKEKDSNGKPKIEIATKKKPVETFNGREYVREESIVADVGIVKAWRADSFGNLQFHGTARNFNPDVAMNARFTIAEVEEIVPVGAIRPEDVHVPGCYVQALYQVSDEDKHAHLVYRSTSGKIDLSSDEAKIKARIGRRAALELKDGMNVNLGIGIPTQAANYIPQGVNVMFESENGLLGMGPYPIAGQEDFDVLNAGEFTVSTVPGASIFSSSRSFAMIRGKHLDVSILGAMEVSACGDIANWIIPGKMVKGMGGAMDLVSSGMKIVVAMQHFAKGNKAKILNKCKLPLTGLKCVNTIITELCVFDVDPVNGLTMIEIAPDTSVDFIRSVTEAPFKVSPNLIPMRQ